MGLEVAAFISGLNSANPVGASDPKSQGDDHIRLIKATLLATLPALTGAVTSTHTELSQLHGGVITSVGVGSAAAPSYSFVGDTDSGLYRVGADAVGLAVGGLKAFEVDNIAGVVQCFAASIGTAAAPSYSFAPDINTGMFSELADRLSLAAGGTRMLRCAADLKTVTAYGGSSAADNAFVVNNFAANATFFVVRGDGQAEFSDGSAASPSMSFINEPDCGFYKDSANSVTLSTSGSSHVTFRDNGGGANLFIDINKGPLRNNDGAVGAPSYTFFNDPDTGIFRAGANDLRLTVGGVANLQVNATQVAALVPVQTADGAAGAPSHSFFNDTDTGMWRQGVDTVVITAGGQLGFGVATAGGNSTCTIGSNTVNRHALFTLVAAGASAGGGAALPASVAGFIDITINGTVRKIPFYAN